jgi:D-tyrosyl-tRNA(Tyr) deacylase
VVYGFGEIHFVTVVRSTILAKRHDIGLTIPSYVSILVAILPATSNLLANAQKPIARLDFSF